jgi:hypothetical protein
LLFPTGIALDPAAGKMYWTDFLDGTIQRANLDGSAVETLVSDLESPQGIALDTTAGKIYWTDDLDDTIQRANLDGSGVEILITGLENPNGIALGSGGVKMYWTSPAKIQQADLDGGNIEDLVSNLVFPQDIAAPGGGKMYWTAPAKIQRADIDGSNIEDLITSELSSPQGIAIDPGDGGLAANGKIYWVDAGTRKIQGSRRWKDVLDDVCRHSAGEPGWQQHRNPRHRPRRPASTRYSGRPGWWENVLGGSWINNCFKQCQAGESRRQRDRSSGDQGHV